MSNFDEHSGGHIGNYVNTVASPCTSHSEVEASDSLLSLSAFEMNNSEFSQL